MVDGWARRWLLVAAATILAPGALWGAWTAVGPASPFCAVIAAVTSTGVRLKFVSLFGSSHTRIAYCEPNSVTVPTPSIRLIGS